MLGKARAMTKLINSNDLPVYKLDGIELADVCATDARNCRSSFIVAVTNRFRHVGRRRRARALGALQLSDGHRSFDRDRSYFDRR